MAFDANTATLPPPPGDPVGPYLSASSLEFLLIELVPMAYSITAELASKEDEWLTQKRNSGIIGGAVKPGAGSTNGTVTGATASLGIGGIGGSVVGMDEDETREAVFFRLDAVGYRVGLGIVEKFSRDKPRFTETLDVIKFLCKDLWILLFKKQIDNLKTNHRGVYVLTDNKFAPITKISPERGRDNLMAQVQPFLYVHAGIIRGALASMGIVAHVQAQCEQLPIASFQIRTVNAKS